MVKRCYRFKDEKLNKLKYKETDLVPFEAKNPRQKKIHPILL